MNAKGKRLKAEAAGLGQPALPKMRNEEQCGKNCRVGCWSGNGKRDYKDYRDPPSRGRYGGQARLRADASASTKLTADKTAWQDSEREALFKPAEGNARRYDRESHPGGKPR